MNRSFVSYTVVRLFVCSGSYSGRDGSVFADLHGIIIQFNAYQSIQLSLTTK